MATRPNPIDLHVGSRVRMRRMLLGMSQEKLGEQLGLTFQQIQKYEKGTNRIGASRLFYISQILDTPLQFFFDDAPNATGQNLNGTGEPGWESSVYKFINTRHGMELIRSFINIQDLRVRKSIIGLVRTLSTEKEG